MNLRRITQCDLLYNVWFVFVLHDKVKRLWYDLRNGIGAAYYDCEIELKNSSTQSPMASQIHQKILIWMFAVVSGTLKGLIQHR